MDVKELPRPTSARVCVFVRSILCVSELGAERKPHHGVVRWTGVDTRAIFQLPLSLFHEGKEKAGRPLQELLS